MEHQKDFFSAPETHHHVSKLMVLTAIVLLIVLATVVFNYVLGLRVVKREPVKNEMQVKEAILQEINSRQTEVLSNEEIKIKQTILDSISR